MLGVVSLAPFVEFALIPWIVPVDGLALGADFSDLSPSVFDGLGVCFGALCPLCGGERWVGLGLPYFKRRLVCYMPGMLRSVWMFSVVCHDWSLAWVF